MRSHSPFMTLVDMTENCSSKRSIANFALIFDFSPGYYDGSRLKVEGGKSSPIFTLFGSRRVRFGGFDGVSFLLLQISFPGSCFPKPSDIYAQVQQDSDEPAIYLLLSSHSPF